MLPSGLTDLQDKKLFTLGLPFHCEEPENKHIPVSSFAFEWVQTKCTLLLATGFFSAFREENFMNNQREENLTMEHNKINSS